MHLPTPAISLPRAICAGAVLFALAGAACAEVTGALPAWKFSGFGTVGAVHSNEHGADFAGSALQAGGAGRSNSWSAGVDSLLGGQVDFRFSPRWSAVVQVVSEQRLDASYTLQVEWANITYQATPELALRVGRIALPMFVAADYRKVGYAYPWVRTPLEVYGVLPISNSDGADITWHWIGEPLRSTIHAFYGHTDVSLNQSARLRGAAIAGLSHTAEAGPFSARASVITTRITMNLFPQLFQALDTIKPQGHDITLRLANNNKRATTMSLGLSYDPGHWFVTGEAGRSKVESYLGGTRSAYVSSGWRHGNFTPYGAYARVWGRPPAGPAAVPLAGLAPGAIRTGMLVNAALAGLMRTIPSQSTLTAGIRWDVASNVALKLQHERVTPRSGSRGMLINSAPDFGSGRTAQVTSVACDFVF
jgi:hypothetical protein